MKFPKYTSVIQTILRNLRYGTNIRPARDWLILTALFLIGIVVSIAWSTVFFFDVLNQESAASAVAETPLDTKKLMQVHGAFEARLEEAERYRSEYRFIDPSL